jgi:thiamine-phosphate pyrophosphorylase
MKRYGRIGIEPSLTNEKIAVTVDFNLYLITDRRRTRGRSLSVVLEQALKGGVKAVQLREKDLQSEELHKLSEEIRRITFLYGAKLLINGRADIARDVNADGVHLPQNGTPVEAAQKIIGPTRLIGMSCHDLDSAMLAQRSGADFITLGPVFLTPSKAVYGSPVGLECLEEAVSVLNIPVFGIGGITESNILQIMATGATGAALISTIMAAEQPQAAAEGMLAILTMSTHPL